MPGTPPAAPVLDWKPEDTADSLRDKAAKTPDDADIAIAWLDALVREKREAEAEKIFTERRDAAPKDALALLLLGRLKGGDDGRTLIMSSLEAKPGFAQAYYALAELEEDEGNDEACLAAAEMLLQRRGTAKDWAFGGFLREQAGDSKGALEAYAKSVALDPLYVAPRVGRGLVTLKTSKPADALAAMTTDFVAPRSDTLWSCTMAIIQAAAGLADAAKASIEQALEAAGADHRALLSTIAASVRAKTPALGKLAIDAALSRTPNDPEFLAVRAILALQKAPDAEAKNAISDALKAKPEDARLWFLNGILDLKQDHEAEALKNFKKALQLDPESGRYALAVAHTLERRGSKDAITAYLHAADLDPTWAEPRIAVALLMHAKGAYDDATEQMEAAVGLAPTDPDLRYFLAILHGDRQGYDGKALDDLREYARLGGKDENALAWLQALEDAAEK